MSADRLAALERRLAALERRRRASLGIAVLGFAALAAATQATIAGAQEGAELRAPFRVVNAQGEAIFTVTQAGSNTRVNIVDRDKVMATWGADAGGASLFLGGPEGRFARMGVNFDGAGTGPSLLLKDNREVLNVAAGSVKVNAPLSVSPKDAVALQVDPERVTVHHDLSIGAGKGSGRTSLAAGGVTVYGADGASPVAGLGFNTAGIPRLIVGAPSGIRGVLGVLKSGDVAFALYHGKRSIGMGLDATTGNIQLSDEAGHTAVALESSVQGNGKLKAYNADGDLVVEAGGTDEGLGVVRAGPDMGGALGLDGRLPYAIQGRRKR